MMSAEENHETIPAHRSPAAALRRLFSYFAIPLLAATVVSGIAIALLGRRATALPPGNALLRRAIGPTAYLTGAALLVFDALGTEMHGLPVAKIAAGLLCGIGTAVLCCQWGLLFSRLDIRSALLHLSLACGIGSLAALGLAALGGPIYFVAFFALAAFGSLWPLTARSRGDAEKAACDAGLMDRREEAGSLWPAEASDGRQPGKMLPTRTVFADALRRMASVTALPCIGLFVFALVMSLRKFSLFGTFDIEIIAGAVAPIFAVALCLAPIKRPFYSFGYEEFLPACALVLIICSCFPVGSAVQVASAALMYIVFSLVALFALASIVGVVHAREFPPLTVLGLTPALIAAASLVGIAGSGLISEDAVGPALLVVCVIYFSGLIMTAIASLARTAGQGGSSHLESGQDARQLGALFQQRCEEVGAKFGLSPRETEIMQMLGRGHNPTFIARTLVLSLSTVRTHIRNLYNKMGVGSQEELIALIDEDNLLP